LGLEEELEEEKLKEGEEFQATGAGCSTGSGRVGWRREGGGAWCRP